MKPLMIILAILPTLIFPACYSSAQIPMNWTRDEINPGEDFTLAPDDSFFTEGLRSCHMRLNTGAVPYLVSDVFYVTPGANYEFSCDVFDNDTAGQVKIYADFYDTYGFSIFGQPPVFSADSPDWQTISWQGIIPVQAVVGYVLVKFYNQPNLYTFTRNAHAWLDHIQFRENGGGNLLANGGFEEWIVGIDESEFHQVLVSVFPNPASGIIHILTEDEAEAISVTDITGRVVMEIDAAGRREVSADVSGLPKGLYMVWVKLARNTINVQKLLIN